VGINYLDVCRRAQEQGDGQIEATLAGIQAVLAGVRPNFTVEYACHSPSEERWFMLSVTPLGGERGGVVVTHTNITSRRQAEEAIVESESRLRQLADAMPQIVYTSSPDGMVDYGNQRWVDYVGVPVEQSIGRKWMEAIHPDDREITRRRFKESGRTALRGRVPTSPQGRPVPLVLGARYSYPQRAGTDREVDRDIDRYS